MSDTFAKEIDFLVSRGYTVEDCHDGPCGYMQAARDGVICFVGYHYQLAGFAKQVRHEEPISMDEALGVYPRRVIR